MAQALRQTRARAARTSARTHITTDGGEPTGTLPSPPPRKRGGAEPKAQGMTATRASVTAGRNTANEQSPKGKDEGNPPIPEKEKLI